MSRVLEGYNKEQIVVLVFLKNSKCFKNMGWNFSLIRTPVHNERKRNPDLLKKQLE